MSRDKELIRIWHENIELWKVHLEEISAQPKQDNTQYLLDQVARLTAENAMLREKWSTPNPEPLSDKELNSLYYQATSQTLREQDTRLAFGFARVIEKAHGITGVDNE